MDFERETHQRWPEVHIFCPRAVVDAIHSAYGPVHNEACLIPLNGDNMEGPNLKLLVNTVAEKAKEAEAEILRDIHSSMNRLAEPT